ncbi:MAG: alpha/beta hydrolase [Actinomycetota bacterium]|nr:alpha/beta hydrolase [Actinomycetota bacterium]
MNARGRTDRGRAALVCVVSLVLASCTGGGSAKAGFHPALQWGTCPSDVEIQYISRHQCGWLTVLQDRSEPQGKTIRLFVVKTWPVDIAPPPYFGSGFGDNLGDAVGYGSVAAGATRLGRIGYTLELRGTGHSEPSLACPEIDALSERAASSLTGDASLMNDFLAGVKACRDRLTAQGVDPSDYDIGAAAQDMEDFRVALGIDQWWNLGTQGTSSRYLFEYLREFPDRVRAAFLDSPQFPQIEEVTEGVDGTRYALNQLFEACRTDTGCAKDFPDLEASWSEAMARLDRQPLRGSAQGLSGGKVDVVVDAGKFLRAARFALGGDGPENLSSLPAMIVAAADGRLSPRLATIEASDPPFCAGYRPLCSGQGFSLGAYLSVFCSDEAPFVDQTALEAAAGDDPAFQAVFARDPYLAACAVWDVPASDPTVHQPVYTDVPLLLLLGQFDSFSPLSIAREGAKTFDNVEVLEIPGQTHNALGFNDCPIAIRNDWIREPTSPPDITCLKGMPSVPFATGGMSS